MSEVPNNLTLSQCQCRENHLHIQNVSSEEVMAQVQAEEIQHKKESSQHRQLYLLETTELQLHMHICSLKSIILPSI